MCEDEECGCRHRGRHHGKHNHRHHHHWKYSTIAKRTGETVNIPEILFEVGDIEEGDFFKIYIKKIKKNEK